MVPRDLAAGPPLRSNIRSRLGLASIRVDIFDPILTDADGSQNILGMSVVGSDFEKLKRYNLEELHDAAGGEAVDNKEEAS